MTPTSGPYQVLIPGALSQPYIARTWFRQTKPYDLPLQFQYTNVAGFGKHDYNYSWQQGESGHSYWGAWQASTAYPGLYQYAVSRAYGDFVGQCKDQQGWGETFAHWQESRAVINDTLTRIASSAAKLRRGNLRGALKDIGITDIRLNGAGRGKRFGSEWLAWTYGVSPLIRDVEAAKKTLCDTAFGTKTVKGRGSASDATQFGHATTTIAGTQSWFDSTKTLHRAKCTVKMQADIRINNPNHYLLNSAGLVSPSVIWDLVPFSFIADYFANTGQWLASINDFYGLTVTRSMTTTVWKGTYNDSFFNRAEDSANGAWYTLMGSKHVSSVEVGRNPTIAMPGLQFYPLKGLSLKRGINSCALILALFAK